jgi:F-type H+-transporting ATPase subunit delta
MPQKDHISPLATAYARSVLELANERDVAKDVGQELEQLAQIVDSSPDLHNFLSSPAIGEEERGRVLEKAMRGRVSELVLNSLLVMNRKGRLGLLRQIADAYGDLLQKQEGIIEVDVYVAQKLTADQLEQVRQKVSAALKREAVVHQYVDASIIGGVVLRVEDRLLDASVRAQLRAVRRKLLAARPK